MAQEARRTLIRALAALLLAFTAGAVAAADPAKKTGGPAWAELTVEQQQILQPLKHDWEALSAKRKKTWVGIAKRYPDMTPAQRERAVRRMQAWAKLTPEERVAARERYRSLRKLPPEKREALRQQWAEYQSLSPSEKRMFDVPPGAAPEGKPKRRSTTRNRSPREPTPPSLP
jgi:hypothetical protein